MLKNNYRYRFIVYRFVIAVKKQLSLSFYRFIATAVNLLKTNYRLSFIVIGNLSYRFIVIAGPKISYRVKHC